MIRYANAAWWLNSLILLAGHVSSNKAPKATKAGRPTSSYIGAWAAEIVDADDYARATTSISPVEVDKQNDKHKQIEPANKNKNGDKDKNETKEGPENKAGDKAVATDPKGAGDIHADLWSMPEAIANITGQAPTVDWEKYLLNDPFGEENGVGPVTVEDFVGGSTWPFTTTCLNGDKMEVSHDGQELCIGVGEGICKDGWQFGIRYHDRNTYIMLWREDDQGSPAYKWFPGALQLCIGDQRLFGGHKLDKNEEYKSPSVEYFRVLYDRCHYYLIGPGSVEAGKFAKLKISVDEEKEKPLEVKFSKLWKIHENGRADTSPDAIWYPVPCEPWDFASSGAPSDLISFPGSSGNVNDVANKIPVSGLTSVSDNPTKSPSAAPASISPTKGPSSSPESDSPTPGPSGAPVSGFPTVGPSAQPASGSPTRGPSASPVSTSPTKESTSPPVSNSPTPGPSASPASDSPTRGPSASPVSTSPTKEPSSPPVSNSPTKMPSTSSPTKSPSQVPTTGSPTKSPSASPTAAPVSNSPTAAPATPEPSSGPTMRASANLRTGTQQTKPEPAGYELSMTTPGEAWMWTRDYSTCNRRLEIWEDQEDEKNSVENNRKGFGWGFRNRYGGGNRNGDGDDEEVGDDIGVNVDHGGLSVNEEMDYAILGQRSKEIQTSKRLFDDIGGDDVEVDKMDDKDDKGQKDDKDQKDRNAGNGIDADEMNANKGSGTVCTPAVIPEGRASTTPMTAAQTCPSRFSPFSGPATASRLDGKMVPESSGICASRINPNTIWSINDYSNKAILHAINSTDGSVRPYPIARGKNYDYEDLACGPGPIPDVAYIYAADIGDNMARRGFKYFFGRLTWQPVIIYRVREPNLSTLQDSELTQWDKLEITYSDGPHNAEAMMIDPISRRIFIITKSSGSIWMSPREWGPGDAKMTFTKVGIIKTMPNFLTGIDISPDGKEIVVKFYTHIYYFCMGSRRYDTPGDSWQDIVDVLTMDSGIKVPYIEEPQGEALCFGPRFDQGIYTLSEAQDREYVPLLHHERL